MKKQNLLTLLCSILLSSQFFSQGGTPGNISFGGNFLGFVNTFPSISAPLQIRNNFNEQIRFFTNNGERMRIFQFSPISHLTTGGGVGINATPAAPISAPGSFLHIGSSIPTFTNNAFVGLFGWRNWMQVGTFNYDASDNMYVGLKNEATITGDRYDAIINWGDNIVAGNLNPPVGPDYLRFIFTGGYAPGGNNTTPQTTAGNSNGLEVSRYSPIGNFGIGNFYNNPNFPFRNPFRRLEVLSDKATPTGTGTPQFRITHTQQNPFILLTTGLFTDFETTNTGDLAINTADNTQVNNALRSLKQRYVGINTNTPNNTLEINSQLVSPATVNAQPQAPLFGLPTGWAGLRFTDLTSNSIPQLNPGQGVLSIDASGDVIYVPNNSTPTANNGLQVSSGNVQLGGDCNVQSQVLAAQLLTDRKIPLNNKNIIFAETLPNRGKIGIGDFNAAQCTPGNLLEVRVNQLVSSPISGLRLTDLVGATPFASNNQVLSINPVGDVILTTAPAGGGALGGICSSGTNPLTSNWEIPLNNNNFIFGGQGGLTSNNVGIGTGCAPAAKLEILQNSGNIASTGLLVTNLDQAGGFASPVIGIKSLVPNPLNTCIPIAGWFETSVNNPICQGLSLYVPQNGGIAGFNYPNPLTAFGAGGILNVNGSIVAPGGVSPSDVSLKNNVTTIPNALNKIKRLRSVTYKWNTVNDSVMAGTHAGFIAQEVDTVIPHLVKTNSITNMKSVAYTEIIPYLVAAMQQQQRQIEKQDSLINVQSAQIAALTGSVASCCSNTSVRTTGVSGNNISQLNIELSDANVIVLNQNVPNPFAEQTTITYNVPQQYKFAQMVFKTLEGKIIKTVDITTRGKGQLNVFANDLSHGLYMYSLIVDGNIIDTKKMVKQ